MNSSRSLWCEKYRPRTVDEYIFHDQRLLKAVTRMIHDKNIPQLLLTGTQGAGKTSLAFILIKAIEIHPADLLVVNASDERGIDLFRDKIRSFSTTMPMGAFKLILLEEADQLTPDAQKALKRFMEEYSETVRFILTCNTENRIIIELRSRCQTYYFRAPDRDAIAEQLVTILAREKVKFDLDLLDKYIAHDYPDVRKIINCLEQNTFDGKLHDVSETSAISSVDWKFSLIDLLETDKWVEARKLTCSNILPNEWEELYRYLYENIQRAPKFKNQPKWEEAIVIIAEHLYKNSIVADPEINAAAMFIELGRL